MLTSWIACSVSAELEALSTRMPASKVIVHTNNIIPTSLQQKLQTVPGCS